MRTPLVPGYNPERLDRELHLPKPPGPRLAMATEGWRAAEQREVRLRDAAQIAAAHKHTIRRPKLLCVNLFRRHRRSSRESAFHEPLGWYRSWLFQALRRSRQTEA